MNMQTNSSTIKIVKTHRGEDIAKKQGERIVKAILKSEKNRHSWKRVDKRELSD